MRMRFLRISRAVSEDEVPEEHLSMSQFRLLRGDRVRRIDRR